MDDKAQLDQLVKLVKQHLERVELQPRWHHLIADIWKYTRHKRGCQKPRGDQNCHCGRNQTLCMVEEILFEVQVSDDKPITTSLDVLRRFIQKYEEDRNV